MVLQTQRLLKCLNPFWFTKFFTLCCNQFCRWISAAGLQRFPTSVRSLKEVYPACCYMYKQPYCLQRGHAWPRTLHIKKKRIYKLLRNAAVFFRFPVFPLCLAECILCLFRCLLIYFGCRTTLYSVYVTWNHSRAEAKSILRIKEYMQTIDLVAQRI